MYRNTPSSLSSLRLAHGYFMEQSLSWYLCWNPFCIFNPHLLVQFDPLGLDSVMISKCKFAWQHALESNYKLWPVNMITHPCCWSLVSMSICQSSHRETKQTCVSFLCIATIPTVLCRVHLSEAHLTRKFVVISCWMILIAIKQRMSSELPSPELMCAPSLPR